MPKKITNRFALVPLHENMEGRIYERFSTYAQAKNARREEREPGEYEIVDLAGESPFAKRWRAKQ